MKNVCAGGGPAGLHFDISMKLRDPSHDVAVYERNPIEDAAQVEIETTAVAPREAA